MLHQLKFQLIQINNLIIIKQYYIKLLFKKKINNINN